MTQAQQPVTLEALEDWKRRVNTIAACSRKDDRYRVGAELKQDIAGAIEALKAAPAAKAVEPEASILLHVIQRLNQNPYSLTKSECITLVQEMRDEAQRAAPAPAAVAVPDGWKLVPVEATQEMVDAWSNATGLPEGIAEQADDVVNSYAARRDWEAMLAATPPAQAQEKGEWTREVVQGSLVIRHPHGDSYEFPLSLLAKYFAPQAQDVQRDAVRVSLPIHWMKELVALCGPEDHELRDRVLKSLERLPLAHAGQLDELNKGEVLVVVTGYTGTGKSAVAGEIEIMCRALGLEVEWPGGDSEKNMTHADWTAALEQYRPRVRIVERNVPGPIAASAAKGGEA